MDFSSAVEQDALDRVEQTIGPSPSLILYSGAKPQYCSDPDPSGPLATITLPADWLTDATAYNKGGVVDWSAAASAVGVAASFRVKQGATCHVQGTVSVSGGGGDLIIDNASLSIGELVTVNSWLISYGSESVPEPPVVGVGSWTQDSQTWFGYATGGVVIVAGAYPSDYTVPAYAELAPGDGQLDPDGTMYHPAARWWSTSFISWKGNIPGAYLYDMNQRVQWNNEGGDWYDANGIAQGATPYASTLVTDTNDSPTDHLITWDVTTLVQQWSTRTHKNYGFFLKCNDSGITRYRSRFYSTDTSKRPVLSVTVGGITTDVACTRSIFMPSGQETPVIEPQYLEVSRNSRHLLLWFNLESFLDSTVTAASLKMYTYDQYGNSTVDVFRTWNPADQGSIGPQVLGLAANYDRDQGIEAHPDVLFVQQFRDANWDQVWLDSSDMTRVTWMTGPDGNGFTLLAGLHNGLKCTQIGGTVINGSMFGLWSPWRDGTTYQFNRLKPAQPKERLFMRYYLMFGLDWAPMPNSGKLPGFDMRYATLQTGMGLDTLPNMGRGNSSGKCDGLTGGSARGSYDRRKLAGSPLANYGGIGFAGNYNIDDTTNNGTPVFLKNHYLAALAKGRWYSVEVMLQMNSVTLPDERPRLVAAHSGYDGVVSVRLASPEPASAVYANGVRWSFGGTSQYSPGYNTTAPITVIDASNFTYPSTTLATSGIVSITKGATYTRVVTSPGHAVSSDINDSYSVKVGAVVGMTGLNGNVYRVHVVNSTTLDLYCDSTGFGDYVSGGKVTVQPVKASGAQNNIIEPQACPGEGNKDGVMRVWVNGRLAGEHTDLRWRHSRYVAYPGSTIYGIDAVWFDEYQGGGAFPQITCSCYVADFVVADSYIGPMVIPDQTPRVVPQWLEDAGDTVNEWVEIQNTSMSSANIDMASFVAAGLTTSPAYADIGYGNPTFGINAYSGGTLKTSGSQLILFGGGGQGAWAGNDVRGLRLEDDVPRWAVLKAPTNASQVWLRGGGEGHHPYMKDGVSPNARHSYWSPQFIDAQNKFYVFGCQNVWETDGGRFNNVDGLPFSTMAWDAPSTTPNAPSARGNDGNLIVKHPVTEDVYWFSNLDVQRWNRSSNTWTQLVGGLPAGTDYAIGAIDPDDGVGGTILKIGTHITQTGPRAFDCATGAVTIGSFTGPYASSIVVGTYSQESLVFDAGLGKYVFFNDTGYLYTIERQNATTWYVDRLTTTGTPPPVGGSAGGSGCAMWGRMQYVPNLTGIVIYQRGSANAFFVRTS